mmetsp:Transcript_80466/g.239787  ORF Transcript_80466/g.239787 Transcript_80466/m.239787 type:complete len:308 (+) Transcript_80466:124-1047(+)
MLARPTSEVEEHARAAESSICAAREHLNSASWPQVHDDTGIEQIILQLQDEVAKQELVLASANEEFSVGCRAAGLQRHEHTVWSRLANTAEGSRCVEVALARVELEEECEACARVRGESAVLAEEMRGLDRELSRGRRHLQREVAVVRARGEHAEAVLRGELAAHSERMWRVAPALPTRSSAPGGSSLHGSGGERLAARARALEVCCAQALSDGERSGEELSAASLRAFHHAQRGRLRTAEVEQAERRASWLRRARRLRDLLARGRRGQELLRGELLGVEELAAADAMAATSQRAAGPSRRSSVLPL